MTSDKLFSSGPDKHFSCFLGLDSEKPCMFLYRYISQQKRGLQGHKRGKLHRVLDFYLGHDNYVYARILAIDKSADFYRYVQLGRIMRSPTKYEEKEV